MEKLIAKVEWARKNYSAFIEGINDIVFSTGSTLDEVKLNLTEAMDFYRESGIEAGDELPTHIENGEYQISFVLEVSAILKVLDGKITRSALSKESGINKRRLDQYLQGEVLPRPETKVRIVQAIRRISEDIEAVIESSLWYTNEMSSRKNARLLDASIAQFEQGRSQTRELIEE